MAGRPRSSTPTPSSDCAGVFLRPVSPYGFALRGRGGANYDVGRWLEFYAAGLDRIVELNRRGVPMVEIYASIIAKKMLTNTDPATST